MDVGPAISEEVTHTEPAETALQNISQNREMSSEREPTKLESTAPSDEPLTSSGEGLVTEPFVPQKSKNQLKRERRLLKRAAQMKIKRPLEKAKRKQKQTESWQRLQALATAEMPYVHKKDVRKALRNKLEGALRNGVKLVVDMSFSDIMSPKEIGQLASQINYMYSTNKKVEQPFCMHLCGLEKGTLLRSEVEKRCPGFDNYKIKVFEEHLETIFAKEDLIYFSPDSPNILTEIDPTKVYVIGGLVDGTPKREVSLSRAAGIGCATARLPIKENMTRVTPHGFNTILTLNQVYEIVMTFHATKSWDAALKNCVPQRKGMVLNGEVEAKTAATSTTTAEENGNVGSTEDAEDMSQQKIDVSMEISKDNLEQKKMDVPEDVSEPIPEE
ncbi:putative tRNA methyltransferase 10-like protein B [Hypsibius exemplaris]|uniref:tRNA methyltransferase 10-like protein B n=1 Tax=Hypsibius exemplaris TaxID=2072580 RepID=A0A1W0X166_HYPEX|nr:putative tRNA methyltransferase 10-like protein B [Hypsibius exemplaris]